MQKHSEEILDTVLNIIGDDLDSESEVNLEALLTLVALIKVIPPKYLTCRLNQIVTKVSPFFDGFNYRKDAAASMKVFGQLANFIKNLEPSDDLKIQEINEAKEMFQELVHEVIVSLILHVNDFEDETREASRVTLIEVFRKHPELKKITELLSPEHPKRLIYSEFVKEFAHIQHESYTEMFPRYVEKSISYFQHTDPVLRVNGVILITGLLVEGSHAT